MMTVYRLAFDWLEKWHKKLIQTTPNDKEYYNLYVSISRDTVPPAGLTKKQKALYSSLLSANINYLTSTYEEIYCKVSDV